MKFPPIPSTLSVISSTFLPFFLENAKNYHQWTNNICKRWVYIRGNLLIVYSFIPFFIFKLTVSAEMKSAIIELKIDPPSHRDHKMRSGILDVEFQELTIRLWVRDFYEGAARVSYHSEKSRVNNLNECFSINLLFVQNLSKSLSQTLQKHQEAATFLLTRAHCYAAHYLPQIGITQLVD